MRRFAVTSTSLLVFALAITAAASLSVPAQMGKLGAVGFCFGGGMVNQLAVCLGSDLNAGVAIYGRQVGVADVSKITAPLMFPYAGNDQGVNAGIAAYEAALTENKEKFESFTYEGKHHGFYNDTTTR